MRLCPEHWRWREKIWVQVAILTLNHWQHHLLLWGKKNPLAWTLRMLRQDAIPPQAHLAHRAPYTKGILKEVDWPRRNNMDPDWSRCLGSNSSSATNDLCELTQARFPHLWKGGADIPVSWGGCENCTAPWKILRTVSNPESVLQKCLHAFQAFLLLCPK
jgi:hypothetical protein